jgi:hypothetical protein
MFHWIKDYVLKPIFVGILPWDYSFVTTPKEGYKYKIPYNLIVNDCEPNNFWLTGKELPSIQDPPDGHYECHHRFVCSGFENAAWLKRKEIKNFVADHRACVGKVSGTPYYIYYSNAGVYREFAKYYLIEQVPIQQNLT